MNISLQKKESQGTFQLLDDSIEQLLLANRRLFVSGPIDQGLAESIIRKIWFLDLQDSKKPIQIVISSPGGSIDAGFAIWDQLKMVSSPLSTIVTGLAASMGSVLALCSPKGKRFATPRSRFLIHQPALSAFVEGQATDLEIQAREILKSKKSIVDLYCEATKRPPEEIEKAIDRDRWMSAEEAKEFGIVDKIITSFSDIE